MQIKWHKRNFAMYVFRSVVMISRTFWNGALLGWRTQVKFHWIFRCRLDEHSYTHTTEKLWNCPFYNRLFKKPALDYVDIVCLHLCWPIDALDLYIFLHWLHGKKNPSFREERQKNVGYIRVFCKIEIEIGLSCSIYGNYKPL